MYNEQAFFLCYTVNAIAMYCERYCNSFWTLLPYMRTWQPLDHVQLTMMQQKSSKLHWKPLRWHCRSSMHVTGQTFCRQARQRGVWLLPHMRQQPALFVTAHACLHEPAAAPPPCPLPLHASGTTHMCASSCCCRRCCFCLCIRQPLLYLLHTHMTAAGAG